MSSKRKSNLDVWYKHVATVYMKYESKLSIRSHSKKMSQEMKYVNKKMAKILRLPDVEAVKREISDMKLYINKVMRRCVRLCLFNSVDSQDALNYAPPWFKLLEERLKLLEVASNMEMTQSVKYFNGGKLVDYITSKIVRCACRAAARELRRDHANGGVGQEAKKRDSTDGDDSEPDIDGNTGGTGKLVIDTSVGTVSGSTSGGVSDFMADDAPSASRATMILVSEEAVREYAEAINMEVIRLHSIWVRIYSQSIHKLMCLMAVGDLAPDKYYPIDWLAADAGLLYDTRMSIVVDETFQATLTLNPLILLYKLVVAAHEKVNELTRLSNFTINEDQNAIGAQCETRNNLNVPSCSTDVKENISSEMRVDGDKTNERAIDFYEGERAKHIWAVVHNNYISSGRASSAVLLQRRWYDMMHRTKNLLGGQETPVAPPPLLLALAKRFPSILTEELPPWSDLVRDHLIYQDSELKKFKMAHSDVRLQVPQEVGENLVFNDLYDWSDDEVEVIDVKQETITVPDSDDEQTDKETEGQIKEEDNIDDSTDVNMKTKTGLNDGDSVKNLENIDLAKAKLKIIFEDDSDDEINHFINGANKPKTSVNSNIGVTLNDVKKNNTNQSVLNRNKRSLEVAQSSVLVNDVNDKVTKITEGSSVSNGVEAEPRNNNLNLDIDNIKIGFQDTFMRDACNELIREVTKQVTNAFTSTEVRLGNDINFKEDTIESPILDDERLYYDDEETSYDGDETCSHEEIPKSNSFDAKLFKLPLVVVTPIDNLPEWRKHYKNNKINCRRVRVKNLAKKVWLTTKQVNKCRPYLTKKSNNGMSAQKNQELGQIPKNIKMKINILSKRLNLSRTCFSREFWSERNMELLELCRPCSIQLKRIPRVVKKIELPDIDEIRRINRSILTAQVAPITVGANRILVIDSTARPTTPERIQNRSIHSSTDDEYPLNELSETQKTKPPSTLTVKRDEEAVSEEAGVERDHAKAKLGNSVKGDITSELLPEGKRIEGAEKSLTKSDIKEKIKAIVRKGDLRKVQKNAPVTAQTGDLNYFYKQKKELERDLRELSKTLILHLDEAAGEPADEQKNSVPKQRKKKKPPSPERELDKVDSLAEWKRQKKQNLVYFNLNLEVDKKSKKKNKSKKSKSNSKGNINEVNKEGSLEKVNKATKSSKVSNVAGSSGNNVTAGKGKDETVSDATIKRPKITNNEDENAPILVIEDSNDGYDALIKLEKNMAGSNDFSLLRKYLLKSKTLQNSLQINESDNNVHVTSEKNTEFTTVQPIDIDTIQENDNASCDVQNSDNNSTNAMAQETNISINTVTKSVSMYYMVNLQNNISGSNTTLISPLPETPCPMPVIQSVTSLSQLPPQSLNQMYPGTIDLNQACQNQVSPIYLNQTSLNQIGHPIDMIQPILNQPNLNQPIAQYSSQVVTVSTVNTFESLVKRPSANKIFNTNSRPSRTTQMPLIQSVSSLREQDQ